MNNMNNNFDAIVIGAGHAGVEAAFALAKSNNKVALITFDLSKITMMPCNPSIGGPAKGIITREIDALGGIQGYYSDLAMIQIKMLNDSKGPAVRAIRAQIDKEKYSKLIREDLQKNSNITLIEAGVYEIKADKKVFKSVVLSTGEEIFAKVCVLTTGTYMNSQILRGSSVTVSGPDGQKTTNKISESLKKLGFELQRFKTGTPARIYKSSIDFSKVEKEILDTNDLNFSNRSNKKLNQQVSCYLTYTNEKTHEIILNNLDKSSMYSGLIKGTGPRYCPSIEDKVVRFSDRNRHQVFFEPETLDETIIYLNGLSTSMPEDIQMQFLKTIPGLENLKIQKYGYAIEYDALNSLDLKHSLETKVIKNFFAAGQINGTSGYEEAAAQGLIAGINAALKLKNKKPLVLKRSDAYIGVLIDDLVIKGTKEPYRMLTSRAEYRLLLRHDNSDYRLSKYGYKLGLISKDEYSQIQKKYKNINSKINYLSKKYLSTNSNIAKKYNIKEATSYLKLLLRPEINPKDILKNYKYQNELLIKIKLEGYIKKQKQDASRMKNLEKIKIPNNINYDKVLNLATEAKDKLKIIKPETIAQAYRISGISPSDIQMLIFHLKTYKKYDN